MDINIKEIVNEGIIKQANENIDMLIDTVIYYKTEKLKEGYCPFGLFDDIDKPPHTDCNNNPNCKECDNYYRNKLRTKLEYKYKLRLPITGS